MSGWASGWEKNNWKKATGKVIENKNLMIKLYYYSKNKQDYHVPIGDISADLMLRIQDVLSDIVL